MVSYLNNLIDMTIFSILVPIFCPKKRKVRFFILKIVKSEQGKTFRVCFRQNVKINVQLNYNFDMLAMIWHEIVCWFLKVYQDLKIFATQEHRIVFVLILDVQNNFMFPTCKNSQKWVKVQKSTDKHSSFDGLIQEK